jgi:hypothetical protein
MTINLGGQKYTRISVPTLAIFACPHNFDFDSPARLLAAPQVPVGEPFS